MKIFNKIRWGNCEASNKNHAAIKKENREGQERSKRGKVVKEIYCIFMILRRAMYGLYIERTLYYFMILCNAKLEEINVNASMKMHWNLTKISTINLYFYKPKHPKCKTNSIDS